MGSKVNYTVVGLFVLVLGAALIVGGLMLTTLRHKKDYDYYVTYMKEAVSGLNVQSPVEYNGVDVGYVEKIDLNPNNLQQVRLLLKIEASTPITQSTVATLLAQGITGITYIGLKATSAHAPILTAKPGQRYPVIKSEPSLLMQLSTVVRSVMENVKKVGQAVDDVFDSKNKQSIKASLAHIATFTGSLAYSSTQIKHVLNNTAKASREFPESIKELNISLRQADKMAKSFNRASQQLALTMRESRQILPSAIQILNRMRDVMVNLQQLSNKAAANPAVLLRGDQPPTPGPGEQ